MSIVLFTVKMTLSAKYDYYPPSPTAVAKPNATLVELATNVVTDWMPGVPNSLTSGFTELFGEMLKPERIDGEDLWIVGPRMTGFEKQWRQVSSWILGVAFCRRVIEELGYRWWAPVSAFTSTRRTTLTPDWVPELPPTDCVVERRNSSKLFPDYVVARVKSGSPGYDVSFAESKGCKRPLTNLAKAPTDWKNQSENGRFIFRGIPQAITQYLLIATRVYARGKRARTRRIQVRAWNEKHPEASISFDALRDVLVAHYFGICERIGLRANAELLALTNYSPDTQQNRELLFLAKERLRGTAQDEFQPEQFGDTLIYRGRRQSSYVVGENLLRIGLSEPAANLIQALQKSDQRNDDTLVSQFEKDISSIENIVIPNEKLFLRNDGVIGEIVWQA